MPQVATRTYSGRSKEQPSCRQCGRKIEKGEKYYFYTFFRGPSYTHCHDHYPRPSQTTQNEVKVAAYVGLENFSEGLHKATEFSDIEDLLDDLNSAAEEARDLAQEKLSNLEDAFPGGCPAMESIQEQCDLLEEWITAIEGAMSSLDDIEAEYADLTDVDHEDEAIKAEYVTRAIEAMADVEDCGI